jgi:hypothetical protein
VLNAITYSHLMRMLMDGEYTRAELGHGTGLHGATVNRYVHQLHRRGVVRIADWDMNPVNKNFVPRFTLNAGGLADEAKPKPKGRLATDREYRARQRALRINKIMAGAT